MNIYASQGTKIRFAHPTHGYGFDQKIAAEHLKAGDVYTVESTVVGDWRTAVYLQEVPGVSFNSVLFEEV